jgi:hypothetical protein
MGDASRSVVGAKGHVYVADVGAVTAPTDVDVNFSLDADWVDVGWVNDDGVTFKEDREDNDMGAWGAFRPIRKIKVSQDAKVTFALREWSGVNFKLAFGGGSIATTTNGTKYSPPTGDRDNKVVAIKWEDGSKKYILVMPLCQADESPEIKLTHTELSDLPVSLMSMQAEDDDEPWYLLTDDEDFPADA